MSNLHQVPSSNGVLISNDRRMVGLEATWEIEQLSHMIRELCDDMLPLDEQGMPLRLRVRGLTARINDLVGVTMALLDEDDDTGKLSQRVHGFSATRVRGAES